MRSEAQRQASRTNGAKSRGPKSPEGKGVSKMNGLIHGLRAEQVVLPGESEAEFEAERAGWFDDWKPRSHTRAVLVERAAAASWRLRRSVRVESARLRKLAFAASCQFDADRRKLIERGTDLFATDPAAAVAMLQSEAAGVDQLLAWWDGLDAALVDGPDGWDSHEYHARLMVLLGHEVDADPAGAGPMLVGSLRLLATNDPEAVDDSPEPLPADEAEEVADLLRLLIENVREELRSLRARFLDPALVRRRAIDAACVDASPEARLQHRYEMAHDRSLRATIKDLIALAKSGADLEEAEDDAEVAPPEPAAPTEPEAAIVAAPSEPGPGTSPGPDAPSEPEDGAIPRPSRAADRDREGRTWGVGTAEGVGSPS